MSNMLVLGLVDVPWWGILLTVVVIFLMYDARDFNYFKKQGIGGPQPIPILGTIYGMFTKATPYSELDKLKKYGDRGYCGEFVGSKPQLVVYNADMLSEVTVKQFPTFPNRVSLVCNSAITDLMLGNLTDTRWKFMRNEMTPTFTTGKLKMMNTEINRCARTLGDSLLNDCKTSKTLEVKEYAGGYTMDVIASTAFGIRVESQKDRNNAFIKYAKQAINQSPANINILLMIFLPGLRWFLMRLGFSFRIFPKEIEDFFSNVAKQTMAMRTGGQEKSRTDFIQLMMKAQRGESIQDEDEAKSKAEPQHAGPHGTGVTTIDILSNAMLFFIAGYDSTANSLSYFLYNMAVHPDIQDKVVKEIRNIIGKDDVVDYNKIQQMTYLEQCVSENLRIHPPGVRVDRVASHDCTINGVYIKKGLVIGIPIYAIHMDPKRWPQPHKFDPERFSPENRKKHLPYSYIPFGSGPRMCIAMRLALQELKVAIIHVLMKVKVTKCDKTQIPMVYDKNPFLILKPRGGIHLNVEPRTER